MSDVTLTVLSSGYNLSLINSNLQLLANAINTDRLQISGGGNVMNQDLDMNGNSILNVATDTSDSSSLITLGVADARYYKKAGDQLTGPMDANSQVISNLPLPTLATSPVRKDQLDTVTSNLAAEVTARTTADQNLQEQISGGTPLEASAFSPISWHAQVIANSVAIPQDVNAWSFGPKMTIESGQTVTIGTGSYWTIADGELQS